jgi:hypothetical protein
MTRRIKIENLAVINNIISNSQPENLREILREHCNKGRINILYSLKDLRPGSDQYIKIEKKRAEIMALPDHDVKYTDNIYIMGRHNVELLRLTLGTYTTTKMSEPSGYYDENDCYEYDEPREHEVTYTFLVKNEYHLESVYLKFSDLFSEYNNISSQWLETTVDKMYWNLRNGYTKDYRKYIDLFSKDIMKALELGYDVSIDNERDMRGFSRGLFLKIEGPDKTINHDLKSLDKILEIKYYWYDDRKVMFGQSYLFDNVLEEYEYAKDNICVEENS